MDLENSDIIEKTIDHTFQITFEYKDMNKVMRKIKEKQLKIVNQKLELSCLLEISVRKKNSQTVFEIFNQIFGVEIKKIND